MGASSSDDEPAKAAPGTLLTTPEIRTAHIVELRPEICTLDLNTQWFGGGAVINSPRSIKAMAERMYLAGSKPELEIFNTGDIMLAHDLVADGTLKMPALFQIVTGIKYGLASTPEANDPQQSWGFGGEPPEAVMKDSGTRDGTL